MAKRIKLTDEVKAAIKGLSIKDKDKLLLQLLPARADIVQRIIFETIEAGDTMELRRQELEELILRRYQNNKNIRNSPKYLHLELRDISGEITAHLKTTKDKFGEVWLNLVMLNASLSSYIVVINKSNSRFAVKLIDYVFKRISKLYKLIDILHEDYRLEFKEPLRELGMTLMEMEFFVNASYEYDIRLEDLMEFE